MWWLTVGIAILLGSTTYADSDVCAVPPNVIKEIQGYQSFADKLIKDATTGSYKGKMYKDLTDFVDIFGHRLTGSKALELSLKYLEADLNKQQLKPKLQPVTIPIWVRPRAYAYFKTKNLKRRLLIKALGSSPLGTVSGQIVVLNHINDTKKAKVKGKIVLYNTPFTNYEQTVVARNHGPNLVSKEGGLGVLVRSVTPFSIGSIHVGETEFEKGVKPIPAAAVSLEDADMLARLALKDKKMEIQIKMSGDVEGGKTGKSFNLVSELTGHKEPKSYVTLSGHIDSWDVGKGAMDDGGGAFLSFHSLLLLKSLKVPPPRRTLRSILWTGEEEGFYGAKAYMKDNKDEMKKWVAAFESDEGLFQPQGLNMAGSPDAVCIVKEILKLFKSIGATTVAKTPSAGTDITVFKSFGFPLLEPKLVKNRYFWFHHTDGDSMRVMNSTMMDRNLALASGTMYIIANLSIPLPKNTKVAAELVEFTEDDQVTPPPENDESEHKEKDQEKEDN